MLTRRFVLKASLAAGGGLLLDLHFPHRSQAATAPFTPNAFIRIDTAGAITLTMRDTEVGQGIYTSVAMLIAEELEVGLDQITVQAAPPDIKLYANPLLGDQATGGSTSIRAGWVGMREAGAAARTMLIAAAAAQWSVDPATCTAARATITHAPTNRTAKYGDLAEAAAKQPIPNRITLKDPARFKLVGTSPRRLDTPAKVNGSMVFGIDVKVPGMRIGTVAASPVKGGKVASLDEAAARKIPGVRDVIKLDDAVAVIADHMWAAKQGLQAANVIWDDGPNAAISTATLLQQLATASQTQGVIAKQNGNPQDAINRGVKKLDAVYQLPFLSHAPMEPINTTLHIRPDGADLWVGTQVPVRAQAAVAHETGLRPDQVTVHNHYMGGAFGRRLDVDSISQAARIAKQVDYPVKLIWTREEDIQHDYYRPYYYDRVSGGLDADGRITGWFHRTTGSSVMARWAPPGMKMGGKLDPDTVECSVETPYEFATHQVEWVRCEPGALTTAWWRGVGPTHNVFIVESFVDELAALAGQDPLAFRRTLLTKNPRALAVMNLAAEKSGWGKPLPPGTGRGIAVQFAFNTYLATVLEVAVAKTGEIRLIRAHAAVDCGPIVNPNTVEAQIQGGLIFGLTMAMYSEITFTNGRVDQSNFHDYRMLRINEAPDIAVHLLPNPNEKPGGIGEAGTAIAAPVLANAIFSASGHRLRRIPFATGQLVGA